jgi:hypothetical protein
MKSAIATCVTYFLEVHGKRDNRTSDAICVGNRDYHQLSRFEIDGGKRICRHLSVLKVLVQAISSLC